MKKAVSIIIFAALCASLICPAFAAGADPLLTSACVSGLTARFTAGEEGIGSIAIVADVEGISENEYFNVSIYVKVEDIADQPDGSVDPMAFRLFKASNVVSGGKMSITMAGSVDKLLGKCVICVQIPNRGDNNDWVRAYLEAPLTVASGAEGETQTVWAPAGFNAAEWLNENCKDIFSNGDMVITGWKSADGTSLADTAIPLTGLSAEAEWGQSGGYLLGDMDLDGVHTVADALAALRISVKLVEPSELDKRIGDVDFDGGITVADALAILRVSAKLAEPFDIYV